MPHLVQGQAGLHRVALALAGHQPDRRRKAAEGKLPQRLQGAPEDRLRVVVAVGRRRRSCPSTAG